VNSQLSTALDYASRLPADVSSKLCPLLRHYGAKPFEEVAGHVEQAMNKTLREILDEGFDEEGRTFGARTISDTGARLMWPAKQALQVAAANLALYPHVACHVHVRESIRMGMSGAEFTKCHRRAEQRAQLVVQALQAAGCINPFEISTSPDDPLLSLKILLEKPRAAAS